MRLVDRFGLRIALGALALVLVAVPFALLLDQVVREGPLLEVDRWAADTLHEQVLDRPLLVDALQVVSFLGKPPFLYAIVAAVGGWLLWRRRVHLAVYLVSTTLVGAGLNLAVKAAVDRERPIGTFDEPVASAAGASFPSGHAMISTVAYGALLLTLLPLVARRRRSVAVAATAVLVLAIGFTRLALGVHWVSDVLGGHVLGVAWVCVTTAAFEIWREERGVRRTEPLEEGVGAV